MSLAASIVINVILIVGLPALILFYAAKKI